MKQNVKMSSLMQTRFPLGLSVLHLCGNKVQKNTYILVFMKLEKGYDTLRLSNVKLYGQNLGKS